MRKSLLLSLFLFLSISAIANMQKMSSSGEILDICIVVMTVLFAIGIFYKRGV